MTVEASITAVLHRAQAGDPHAGGELLPLVYDQLRRLAAAKMAREPSGSTLQPTALVHEAFLRLGDAAPPQWHGRAHFFAAAAEAMRRILVEQARRRMRRGRATTEVEPAIEPPDDRVLDIDAALNRLTARDPRRSEVVKLRYFVGLTTAETAAALGVSVGTIEREWRLARAMLQRELEGLTDDPTATDPA